MAKIKISTTKTYYTTGLKSCKIISKIKSKLIVSIPKNKKRLHIFDKFKIINDK